MGEMAERESDIGEEAGAGERTERSKSVRSLGSPASLVCSWEIPLIPLLERSCSDCGSAGILQPSVGETYRRKQGKFRRVLSETW